ncbi:MAG: amidohydrolase [Desulfobacterales bacterium]|nr:amidohydrolase [Desulfobacterales bacterium]
MNKIRIALAVQNCQAGAFDQNLKKSLETIRQSAEKGADMVVFPEMNLTGYAAGDGIKNIACPLPPSLDNRLGRMAMEHGIMILVGLAERLDSGQIFPTHRVYFPDGDSGSYRKTHLAPNEKAVFTPGDQIPVFTHPSACFGIQLCYDSHFPELTTTMALKGADVIIIPHASPRGNPEMKFASWMRHLSARAFDNGVFVLAVNQTGENGAGLEFPGVAVAIGPDGNIISKYLSTEESVLMVDLEPELLEHVRSHRMRYFLPNRRQDLFPF